MKKLYYMTQYADYMTDTAYYESMSDQVKKLDKEQLAYLCKDLAPKVSDQWNKILFDILYYVKAEDLDILVTAWELLAAGEFEAFLYVLNIDYERYLNPDNYIYDYYTLDAIADDDFRANGVNAGALYWYKELDAGYSYFVFNSYQNGFYYYETFDDALLDFVDFDSIKNDILDYFK